MKTKMVFGLLAVLVAAAAVSTIALPALASAADAGNATAPSVTDPILGTTQARQCTANCTQAQSRIRAMDGSCGLCDGTCTGGGSQYRYGQQQAGGAVQAAGASFQNRGRARNQSCLTPTA